MPLHDIHPLIAATAAAGTYQSQCQIVTWGASVSGPVLAAFILTKLNLRRRASSAALNRNPQERSSDHSSPRTHGLRSALLGQHALVSVHQLLTSRRPIVMFVAFVGDLCITYWSSNRSTTRLLCRRRPASPASEWPGDRRLHVGGILLVFRRWSSLSKLRRHQSTRSAFLVGWPFILFTIAEHACCLGNTPS